ncbi:hypothetical protein ACQRIU_005933 [Beauveria bassiana]
MAAISAPSFDVTGEDVSAGESQHWESPCSTTLGKRSRTPTALSIWAESRQPNCHEPERNRHGQKIWYCKRCSYSQAAHNRPRSLAKTLPSTGCSSNKLQDKKATILNKIGTFELLSMKRRTTRR